tara:strand:+ start:223 stop:513 length:291 start_codon:yes stop_codon:yes gene_type:complete
MLAQGDCERRKDACKRGGTAALLPDEFELELEFEFELEFEQEQERERHSVERGLLFIFIRAGARLPSCECVGASRGLVRFISIGNVQRACGVVVFE